MVIDYSIKAGRSEADIDSAYLGQKQDASAWLNIKEGNEKDNLDTAKIRTW